MIKKVTYLFIVIVFFTAGCVKETFDSKMLAKNSHLSPTVAFPVVIGSVSFSELEGWSFWTTGFGLRYIEKNFMKVEGLSDDNPIKPENIELLRLDIAAKNGFPLKVGMKMQLLDSATNTIKGTVDATNFLEAALVDKNGIVTAASETKTGIKFTREFLSSIPDADKVIFLFTFNTPNNGQDFVSILPEYRIYFKAALIFKPDLYLK